MNEFINEFINIVSTSLVEPTLAAFIVWGTEQLGLLIYECLERWSSQIRYAEFLKHGIGHAFECLGWPCPATFISLPFETPTMTLHLLAPQNTR